MATIATCPGCTAQLAIPDSATPDSRVQCPECAAKFGICETVQIALPRVRILPSPDISPAAGDTAPKTDPLIPVEESTASAPLASWETRLKKAIASDVDTEPATVTQLATGAEPKQQKRETAEPNEDETPSFDAGNQLDVPSSAAPQEPIADDCFGAQNQEEQLPVKDSAPASTCEHAMRPAEVEGSEIAFRPAASGRPRRRRWPKIVAAVVGGPVLGTLLGFYGLLWIKGPTADYLQMARILPKALLPTPPATPIAGATRTPNSTSTANQDQNRNQNPTPTIRPSLQRDLTESVPPLPLISEATPSSLPKPGAHQRDGRVQPASAEQPLQARRLPGAITAGAFSQLVADAQAEIPNFLQGSLTDKDSFQRKGQAYMALCRLAEHFAFADQLALSPQAREQIRLGNELFREATSRATALGDLTHIASRWWEYDQRSSLGIFFVGRIGDVNLMGSHALCQVVLPGRPALQIPVLFDEVPYGTGELIAVVGTVNSGTVPQGAAAEVAPQQIVISQVSYAVQNAPAFGQ